MTSTSSSATSLFELLGGVDAIRALVDRFYDLMDIEPTFAALRSLHPETLDGSRDKLAWFLTGWSGGPDLYVERYGHPRLRARHLPYAIGIAARDQWLQCMEMAIRDRNLEPALRDRLRDSFAQTADWMRNRPG